MKIFINFLLIFFIGCIFGWILEVIFKRMNQRKWINPGFLLGPYLPIYGFGLCTLTDIYLYFKDYNYNTIFIILFMGLSLTLIELVGGLIFIEAFGIKIWDYSDRKYNFKGLICPLFSCFWTIISVIFYYFIADVLINLINIVENNTIITYLIGILSGIMIIDVIYSTNIVTIIKKYTKNSNIIIKLNEIKNNLTKDIFKFINTSLKNKIKNYKDKK